MFRLWREFGSYLGVVLVLVATPLRAQPVSVEGHVISLEGLFLHFTPDLLALVLKVRPHQCTFVPVVPGEITSQAGWAPGLEAESLPGVIHTLKSNGIRVSLFVDPRAEGVRLASSVGADRVELYTEPFARAFERGPDHARRSFELYADAARLARSLGLGVNAGHDLDLDNLVLFRALPHLDEVSIGHAIVSRALFVGLETVVREYLAVLAER